MMARVRLHMHAHLQPSWELRHAKGVVVLNVVPKPL